MPDSTENILDPAATDETSENARNGAAKRRDPNEPAAVVGLGASAGGIAVLQQFFTEMPADSGLAFVVVMHLSPEHESTLAKILQLKTSMPVMQVNETVKVQPNHVYVIPPNKQLTFVDSRLELVEPQQAMGRRVTIDLFFRTLAQSYGQRSVGVILSGTDSDGAIGLKHVRGQGGVTIAQDPKEAEHDSMPLTAIATGMVDWVLPVAELAPRLMEFVRNENLMRLPPEIPETAEPDAKVKEAPGGETISDETRDESDESALHEVLTILRRQTGDDFSHYKRATLLRRIARRMQVNSTESIPRYLEFFRQHPAEAIELHRDLLIGVTHFFRDQAAFAALESNVPQLFAGKQKDDQLRVWVAGCATGEEAYSIAMLLCEHAERLESPPSIQVFATDIDEQAIQEARLGTYPVTIEADVSTERLRRFFAKDHGRYRVRKSLREKVLFAAHNLLSDAPFSNLDLASCRNLLIYLKPKAQDQVFDIFHFSLRSGGLLFIGGSENTTTVHSLFSPVDGKHRVYVRRSVPRPSWKIPVVPGRAPGSTFSAPARGRLRALPPLTAHEADTASTDTCESLQAGQERRSMLFGELHLKLLEQYAPPSVVVNESYDIVHLSENAGRYLHFVAGEPTANLLKVVNPALQIELRAALFRAAQSNNAIEGTPITLQSNGGSEVTTLNVRPIRAEALEQGFYLVTFAKQTDALPAPPVPAAPPDALARDLHAEIDTLKRQLNEAAQQIEAAHEEQKASNEEFQALNEEMRSAIEELETSQEELQSVNEELVTVNNELKNSVEDLSRTNADLTNLMASTDVGTIFLDRQLRIQRFTPSAQKIFNLIPADVGRPISDITSKLAYDGFIADAEKVLDDLVPIEREVSLGEQWLLVRLAPYRTVEDRIAGTVGTFMEITRRKRAEDELRELHAKTEIQLHKFNTVMAAVPDFVYQFSLEGRFTYISQSLLDLWRLPHNQAIGRNFHELDYPPELATKLQRQIQEVIATGRSLKDETPYTSAIGSRQYEYIFFPLLGNDGSLEGVGGVTRDITERRQAEDALRESEARFRAMFEQASVGIVQIGKDGRFVAANRGFCKFLGYSEEELEQLRVRDITHPEDYAQEEQLTRQLSAGEIPEFALDKRYVQKDGRIVWGTMTATFVRHASGEPLYTLAIVQAIGDRKRAEGELRKSEERFRQFAENSADVFWIVDAETGRFEYVNPVYEEMWGEPRDAVLGTAQHWLELVHPKDQEKASQIMPRVLKGKPGVVEYRIIRPVDGEVRWIRDTGFPIPDETGRITRVAGVAQDVTVDRQQNEALRESEERYRLLVDGARDYAIFLLDPSNEIVYWSAGAERVFGWSAEEAIGQSGELVFTPEDRASEAEEKEIETALKKGFASDRRWHLRKDGSRIWVDGVMRRLDDETTGALRGFAKIARDATEQREAENALRAARDEMEQRVVERTQDLLATNNELERTMRQRQQLEKELLEISEREKRRIGEDLHDAVCQELTATALFLKSTARKVAPESAGAAETLEEAAQIVNRNVGLTRDLARGLQPADLKGSGLKEALRALAAQATEGGDVNCHFKAARGVRVTDDTVALHLYRVVQEALKNALKHSGAKNILISLDRSADHICVSVQDDGKGFPPKRRSKGLGLHIMRYRANVLGGDLKIEKRPRGGMDITCVIPVER